MHLPHESSDWVYGLPELNSRQKGLLPNQNKYQFLDVMLVEQHY